MHMLNAVTPGTPETMAAILYAKIVLFYWIQRLRKSDRASLSGSASQTEQVQNLLRVA